MLELEFLPAPVRDQPQLAPDRRQTLVGVVLPQDEPILRARGHHAVRVGDALCDEIVDQRADVRARAVEHKRRATENFQRRVRARDEALCRRLLVAGAAVELSRAVKPGKIAEFQRRAELERVAAVVFNRVGTAHDLHVFETLNRAVKRDLHILGQRRAHALQVHFLRLCAARLDEKLVARLFGKAHDFVLDARAIARTDALDHPAIER